MRIRWTASCAKHGIERDDALNAMLGYIVFLPRFDQPRGRSTVQPDLWIGPQRREADPLLEVMSETNDSVITVFHVMIARRKFLDMLDEGEEP